MVETKQPEAYNRRQVADRLKVSLRTVDLLLLSGQIKSFKVGGKLRRVSEAALAAYIKKEEAKNA